MSKEVVKKLKILVLGAQASPAPPLGPILGQSGVPIPQFCQEFNEKTAELRGMEIPVLLEVYKDRTFKMTLRKPTVISLLKKNAGIDKGSSHPNSKKVGKVSMAKIEEVARIKLSDLNTNNIDSAIKTVVGSAKSLGLEIID